jgi:hypothetical protein
LDFECLQSQVITPGGKGPTATFNMWTEPVVVYFPKLIANTLGIELLEVAMPVLTPRPDLLGKEILVIRELLPNEKPVKKDALPSAVWQYIGASAAVAAAAAQGPAGTHRGGTSHRKKSQHEQAGASKTMKHLLK